jgi:hypothetical protein
VAPRSDSAERIQHIFRDYWVLNGFNGCLSNKNGATITISNFGLKMGGYLKATIKSWGRG